MNLTDSCNPALGCLPLFPHAAAPLSVHTRSPIQCRVDAARCGLNHLTRFAHFLNWRSSAGRERGERGREREREQGGRLQRKGLTWACSSNAFAFSNQQRQAAAEYLVKRMAIVSQRFVGRLGKGGIQKRLSHLTPIGKRIVQDKPRWRPSHLGYFTLCYCRYFASWTRTSTQRYSIRREFACLLMLPITRKYGS